MHTDTETDTTAEVAAIRRVDTELLAALNARDIERWLSCQARHSLESLIGLSGSGCLIADY